MKDQPRIKVLVAEDEANLGTILEGFLSGRGYAVTTCRDGRTAESAAHFRIYRRASGGNGAFRNQSPGTVSPARL